MICWQLVTANGEDAAKEALLEISLHVFNTGQPRPSLADGSAFVFIIVSALRALSSASKANLRMGIVLY